MLEHLAKVVDEIRSVKHTLKKNARIAHYTDNGALKSMLTLEPGVQKNLLRLYNVAYVNDPNEGRHLLGVTEQSLGRANPLHEFFDEKAGKPVELQGQDFLIFVGSFSLVSDRLDLWRAYGGNGEGFCIETPLAAFPRGPDQPLMGGTWTDKANGWAGSRLFSVCYKRKEAVDTLKRLSAPLDKISAQLKHLSRPGAADAIKGIVVTFLNELLYLYKDEEYEREKEARMIVAKLFDDPSLRRDPRGALERVYLETGGLFFEPEGSRIFIGPKVEKRNEVKIDIRHRLARLKWSHCKVDYSDVPYR